jgi:nucleoside-diphosphate-sugar epimerase
MRVLIIGGTGLISTAITQALLDRGITPTLYNRGRRPSRLPVEVPIIYGDRSDRRAFEEQMAGLEPFDCVIDMICFTPEDAESAIRAFAGRAGRLIFCSTVDVYAKPASRYPITESEPRQGNNAYGQGKVRCEELFEAVHDQGALPVTIIRPAMSYGEGGALIHSFGWGTYHLDRMRKGKPLIVHGDGSAIWVACHVEDVARAFVAAVENPATQGRAYHVAGEEWLTWNRYYQLTAEALDAPPPTLVHIPTDLLQRIAPQRAQWTATNFQGNNIFDNSAARADLGFRYTVPFLDGARRTIAWLDAHDRIEDSDQEPFDDRLLAAWARLADALAGEVGEVARDPAGSS